MGAASSTCIAFIMMAISFYFINKKIFPIIYNLKKLLVIFFVSFIIYLIKIYLEPELHLKMILSIVYPIIMLIFGIVNYNKIYFQELKQKLDNGDSVVAAGKSSKIIGIIVLLTLVIGMLIFTFSGEDEEELKKVLLTSE